MIFAIVNGNPPPEANSFSPFGLRIARPKDALHPAKSPAQGQGASHIDAVFRALPLLILTWA